MSDRLVQAAYEAITVHGEQRPPLNDATRATVAVLRELSDLDCTWDDVRLEALANEIEGEPVMINPPGFDEGFKRFQEEWPKRFTPEDPAHRLLPNQESSFMDQWYDPRVTAPASGRRPTRSPWWQPWFRR